MSGANITCTCNQVTGGNVLMEASELIIADLRWLGVKANQILTCRPDQQLKDMRDGLLTLNKRTGLSGN